MNQPQGSGQAPEISHQNKDPHSLIGGTFFTLFAIATAFSTYFCMYAFRKPFSAASYEGLTFLETKFDLKTVFVVSQILGYALSKIIGIKLVSEVTRSRRFKMLIGMISTPRVRFLNKPVEIPRGIHC